MSFFMGFATGLAKSVDTQLKESIERTRDNIDMVSKWRLKKAEEREKERRSKDKEIEKMIKDAAYVISGDQNNINAQNIAASLYEERGLSGFNEDIEFMREQSKKGIRPLDFINRANKDLPVRQYSPSEIIRSLSDAESSYASSDMVFPKGTITPSGIISKIVPGFDVMQAGQERATQQMQQIGMATTPVAPSLSFDRYTFDREGLGYATKSVNEKLTYLRNIMDDPSSDPETATLAGQRLDELLNKSMTGEEKSAIQAINLKLSRMSTQDTSAMTEMQFKAFDTEQDALIKRRQGLEDTIALRDAKTEKEKLAIEANIAFREGRVEEGFRLTAQAEDYGTQVTNATIINRIKARASRLQSDEDYMNSTGKYAGDGFAEDRTKIQIVQANEEELMGVSFDKVQAFATQIRQAALAEFKAQHPSMYKDLNITTNEDGTIDSTSFINALTNAKGNVSEKYNEILNSVIQRYKTIGAKHNVSENTIDSAVMLLTGKGLPAATGGTDAAADTTAAGQTDAALAGQPPAAGTDVAAGGADAGAEDTSKAVIDDNEVQKLVQAKVQLDKPTMDIMRADYPNTLQGALDFIEQDIFKQKEVINEKTGVVTKIPEATANEILAEATGLHDDNFTNTIRTLLDPQNEVNAAAALDAANVFRQGDVGITVDADARNSVVQSLVQDIPNLTVEAANHIVNKVVQQRLDVEPENEAKNINIVTNILRDKKFLTPFGALAGYRRNQATDYVARLLNVSTEEASRLINKSLAGPDDGIDAFDIETISPGGTMSEATGDERSDSLLFDRDQMKRGLMYPLEMFGARVDDDAPGVPVSLFGNKSEEGEQDNRKARGLVVPSERTSPENRMRGASNAALIAAYISEDMSDLERKEIRRRLETDKSFVDQLAAVLDRVNKRKKGQDSKLTPDQLKALRSRTSKQQVPMARGGLMRR